MLYMVLMLPLGIAYFTFTVTLMAVSLACAFSPLAFAIDDDRLQNLFVGGRLTFDWGMGPHVPGWGELALVCVFGVLLLFVSMHVVRGIGYLHGQLAKHLLVRIAAS
jgi:hypothetical protein